MAQENRTLRTRSEEFVASASKLNRQVSDLEGRRDDLTRRVEELETALTQERAAHAKLKAAHLDAAEFAPADRLEPARRTQCDGVAFGSSRADLGGGAGKIA